MPVHKTSKSEAPQIRKLLLGNQGEMLLQPPPASFVLTSIRRSTRSLKSEAAEAILENGRYYCDEFYLMPCDEAEQTRLSITYQTYLFLLGKQITLGQVRNPERILDVGTGTADWAIAAAERFPNAEIIGTDITTTLHPQAAPPNVSFELDDAQDEWTYNEPFDFIHLRELRGAFSDWGAVYAQVAEHLKAGGVVEVADHGMINLTNEPEDSYLSIFSGALLSASEKAKTPLTFDHMKKAMFEKAGLSITKNKSFDLPIGPWSDDPRKKTAGKIALVAALEGLEAYSLRLLTRYQGWTEEEVRDMCGKVQAEMMEPDAKPFVKIQFVVARKMAF